MDSASIYQNKKTSGHGLSFILTVYIALKPLYINQSGSLQISDMFLVLGLAYILLSSKGTLSFPAQCASFLGILSSFVLFTCVVNGMWTMTGYNYLKPCLYYVFNFIAVLTCFLVYIRVGADIFSKAIFTGVFLSSIVTLIGLVLPNEGARETGFFNNPNQLGYYGIVIIAFVFLVKRDRLIFKEAFVLAVGIWSIVASLSKAAFIGLIAQSIICALFMGKNKSAKVLAKRIILIVAIGVFIYIFIFSDVLDKLPFDSLIRMRNRLFAMATENDSSLGSGRGYDRVKEMGKHILWGMGEGNYGRFSSLRGLEVHSTFVSIIVSYGFFGFFLYLWLIIKTIFAKGFAMKNIAVLSGVLIYSLSHNGVRNTLVWILLAFTFLISKKHTDQR